MYAIIQTGGKQYRVAEGQIIQIETLASQPKIGDTVDFNTVLLVGSDQDNSVKIGAPFVDKSLVSAEVLRYGRAKKINIIKFKRRKHHLKRMGHRQNFIEIKINQIQQG